MVFHKTVLTLKAPIGNRERNSTSILLSFQSHLLCIVYNICCMLEKF